MNRISKPAERFEFGDLTPIIFTTPGHTVTINADYIDYSGKVVLYGQINLQDLNQIISGKLFNLDEQVYKVSWIKEKPIDVSIMASQDIVSKYESIDLFVNALILSDPFLLDNEKWFLLESVQYVEIPGSLGDLTSFGFQTKWANPF